MERIAVTDLHTAPTFRPFTRAVMDALFGRDADFVAASVHASTTDCIVVGVRLDGTARAEVRRFDNRLEAKRRLAGGIRAYDVLHAVDADDALLAWLQAASFHAEHVA